MADESILTSIKKLLGLSEDYTEFDTDIVIFINSALSTLNQLAVGPENSLRITDKSAVWEDLVQGQPNIDAVKDYIYLKVKLIFDPPQTSFAITAFENMLKETEWRLNVVMEMVRHPNPDIDPDQPIGTQQNPWNLTGGLDFPAQAQVGDYGTDWENGNVWRKA